MIIVNLKPVGVAYQYKQTKSKLENFKEKIRFCFGTRILNKNYSVNDFGEKISGDQDDILSHLLFKKKVVIEGEERRCSKN